MLQLVSKFFWKVVSLLKNSFMTGFPVLWLAIWAILYALFVFANYKSDDIATILTAGCISSSILTIFLYWLVEDIVEEIEKQRRTR